MPDCDVLVLGGGPGGLSAAISCQQAGLQTLLLERENFPRQRPGETFHPGLEPLLAQLGVLEEVDAANFLRHEGTWVEWDGSRRFEPFGSDVAGPWRGFQAWRADFDTILLHRARRLDVWVHQPCQPIRPLVQEGRVCSIETSQGVVKASFVIDATGRHHWLARHMGLPLSRDSPSLVAWYGYVEGACPARDAAPAIVADRDGWIWTARVRPGVYTWTRLSFATRNICHKDWNWTPEEFRGLKPCLRTRGADVTWKIVTPTAGPGYFLVGDAAAVLDPASSHGVLKAIMSGMFAAHLISACTRKAMDETEAREAYNHWMSDWFHHDVKKLRELYSVFPHWEETFGLS